MDERQIRIACWVELMHCRFSSLSHDINLKIVTRRPHLILYTIWTGRRCRLLFIVALTRCEYESTKRPTCMQFYRSTIWLSIGSARVSLWPKKLHFWRPFRFLPKMCVQLVRRRQPHTHTYAARKMNFRAHMVKPLHAFDFEAVPRWLP